MDEQQILCAWALERYGDECDRVSFDNEYDGGYSEYTPGVGAYCEVVTFRGGRTVGCHEEHDYNEIIVSVCRFAARYA